MVIYNEVMKNVEAREMFKLYLKNVEHSVESLNFLEQVDQYRKSYQNEKNTSDDNLINHCKVLFEKLNTIASTFLKDGSNMELNIGGKLKNVLRQKLETLQSRILILSQQTLYEFVQSLHPDYLFKDVEMCVYLDLSGDQFPRFARSSQIQQFLQKKGEAYTRSIAVDISRGFNVDFRFKPKDLIRDCIIDRDFYFGLSLMEDSPDWELMSPENSKNKISSDAQLFYSKTPYIFRDQQSQGLQLNKLAFTVPYPVEDTWKALCHTITQNDPSRNISKIRQLGYKPANPKRTSVIEGASDENTGRDSNTVALVFSTCELDMKIPGMKRRDIPHTHSTVYDEGIQGYICCGHTATFEGYKTPKGCVHSDMFIYYILNKVGDHSTRVNHIIYTDIHIPRLLSKLATNRAWRKRCQFIEETLLKTLKDHTENGTRSVREGELTDLFELNRSALDNIVAFPNRSWYKEYLNMLHSDCGTRV